MTGFLTTKEVADLLRLKERKVYDLVRDNAIPVSRATGKLLFPRDLVLAWVAEHMEGGAAARLRPPPVIAGSHDPLLDWALRESGAGIGSYTDGSLDGLHRVADGRAMAAGLHLPEFHDADVHWNIDHIRAALPAAPVVAIHWAVRAQGLVLRPDLAGQVTGVADLGGLRIMPRQPAAGSGLLLRALLERQTMATTPIMLDPPARNESDLAQAVADGAADAGMAIEAVARQYRLAFVPVLNERFDLLIGRHAYFEAPFQTLLAFARTDRFAEKAAALGGYDIGGLGTVRYNGP